MTRPALNVSERLTAPPVVAVSTVIFALQPPVGQPTGADASTGTSSLWLPLVRRTREPFRDAWALPGGPLAWDQSLDETARSTLHAATGLAPRYLEQLYTFGGTERSASDLRVVTVAYWALIALANRTPLSPIENVAWFPADSLPLLAFDHADIVTVAQNRLRAKAGYADVAVRFLGEEFTLSELRRVHDAVLGTRSDPANFRRRMLGSGRLEPTGATRREGPHRPARCYRFVEPAGSDLLERPAHELSDEPPGPSPDHSPTTDRKRDPA
ncbi:NUDIX domain-containing protein [Georgenia halophila]|uniref:NUDIX domain-containing protein n=1 Tax=Georgenia halophila TaxID=620889 RepID=A0ABP8LFT1_9MICO